MYYPEALSGVISPTTNVLSPLTLALLEDSGWYRANYTKAHVSPWGELISPASLFFFVPRTPFSWWNIHELS